MDDGAPWPEIAKTAIFLVSFVCLFVRLSRSCFGFCFCLVRGFALFSLQNQIPPPKKRREHFLRVKKGMELLGSEDLRKAKTEGCISAVARRKKQSK